MLAIHRLYTLKFFCDCQGETIVQVWAWNDEDAVNELNKHYLISDQDSIEGIQEREAFAYVY